MASYHLSVKTIKRSAGRSATAAAAYRAGLCIEDERTGEMFDYTRRRGVDDHAILTPSRAPEWAKDSASLWNAVEQKENRVNSQLARENVLALPHELNEEQRRVLQLSIGHGLSHERIADVTGIPLGTVKTHLRRGLIRVRGLIEDARERGAAGRAGSTAS